MPSPFNQLSETDSWRILADAATRALEEKGFTLERLPGRGRFNVWNISQKGTTRRASIRTTKDRWFAFPALKQGTKWKTLDGADVVVVAAVDHPKHPVNVEVYMFDAAEVRKRFDAAYAARTGAGLKVKDNYGMWVGLDKDDRGVPASVGSGLAEQHSPIAVYPISEFHPDPGGPKAATISPPPASSLPEVMDWARHRIAVLSGVGIDAVKLDLRIQC